jgi:hypothetical protein
MPNITLDLGMEGRGAVADTFFKRRSSNDEDKPTRSTEVPLPMFGETNLELPPFFIVASKKKGKTGGVKWRLANPLTEIRNLATRKGKKSINITRNEDAEKPVLVDRASEQAEFAKIRPSIYEFSARDQAKIIRHFRAIMDEEAEDRAIPTKNKPRGFPAVLYKNAKKAGLKETKEKVYTRNTTKGKAKAPLKYPRGRPRKERRLRLMGEEDEDEEEVEEGGLRGEPSAREKKRLEEEKKAREKKKNAKPMDNTDRQLAYLTGVGDFYNYAIRDILDKKSYKDSGKDNVFNAVERLKKLKEGVNKSDEDYINDLIKEVKQYELDDPEARAKLLPPNWKKKLEEERAERKKKTSVRDTAFDISNRLRGTQKSVAEHKALLKEAKQFMEDHKEAKKFYDLQDEFNKSLQEYKEIKGKGLTEVISEGGDICEDDGGGDGEGSGGGILSKIVKTAKTAYRAVKNPKKAIQEVKKFGKNLIYGRLDAYPPSVQKIIDANKDAIVQSITLHRKPLSSTYTTLMSWATGGETDKRLKEQPKDTLYHISMWVKLSNGKTLKVEKNEVIAINPNPKAHKD